MSSPCSAISTMAWSNALSREPNTRRLWIQAFRADRHRSNGPFRGTKADVWEAGHHVPFFVRWPAMAGKAKECSDTICLTDIFATCAEAAGADLPKNVAVDSFSFLGQLKGLQPAIPRAPVINHSAGGMFAIRDGQWKLVLGNGSGGRQAPKGKPFEKPYMLFNLEDDIAEANDVIESNTDRAAAMEATFQKLHDSGRSRP